MSIQEIAGGAPPVPPLKKGKGAVQAKESPASADKVQLSKEAQMLYESEQTKRQDEIRTRLDNGFYRSDEATERIADGLLEDLKNTKP